MATIIDKDRPEPSPASETGTADMPIREVKPAPDRWRNALGKYRVWRSEACIKCGKCEEICPRGVHVRPEGYVDFAHGLDWHCTAEQVQGERHLLRGSLPARRRCGSS